MSEEMDILRDSYDGLISDEVRDAQLAALAPSPADAGLPAEDVERVARAIQDASAREGVVLVGYEVRSLMTAAGPLGLESARRLAAAALTANAALAGQHTTDEEGR